MKHRLELNTLLDCWRLCRRAIDLQLGDGRRVRFETRLGLRLGTRVFLEEIVGTYYYNTILGFVYFGAMLVLVSLALYLAGFPLWTALIGFGIEAVFLFMLAVVTSYTRADDGAAGSRGLATPENVLVSMNGTVREMTNAVSDLFRLISQSDLRQDVLLSRLTEVMTKNAAEHTRQQLDKLEETNALLRKTLEALHAAAGRPAAGESTTGAEAVGGDETASMPPSFQAASTRVDSDAPVTGPSMER